MLTSGVVLLHDSPCPDTSTVTRTGALLEHFNLELFDYPPYSPYLATSDYRLFTYPKTWLESQRFNNYEMMMDSVNTWLSSHAADFSDTGIKKIIPRYKCLNSGSDYVEK
jgi:histone-lysine N-methyltransferase SETMAR